MALPILSNWYCTSLITSFYVYHYILYKANTFLQNATHHWVWINVMGITQNPNALHGVHVHVVCYLPCLPPLFLRLTIFTSTETSQSPLLSALEVTMLVLALLHTLVRTPPFVMRVIWYLLFLPFPPSLFPLSKFTSNTS